MTEVKTQSAERCGSRHANPEGFSSWNFGGVLKRRDPQRKTPQKGADSQSVFFTTVDPMGTEQDRSEVEQDLEKTRTDTLGELIPIWWIGEACSKKDAITLLSTPPAICQEKVVCMKKGEALFCKVHQSPKLVPNLKLAHKDVLFTDSRKSDDLEDEVHASVDFRIPGIHRKETVRRYLNNLKITQKIVAEDSQKSEEINHFSQKSKGLITEMAIPKSSSSTRPIRRDSVQIAPHIWKLVSFFSTCGKCMQFTEKSSMRYAPQLRSAPLRSACRARNLPAPECVRFSC